jgi:hypothetical protein
MSLENSLSLRLCKQNFVRVSHVLMLSTWPTNIILLDTISPKFGKKCSYGATKSYIFCCGQIISHKRETKVFGRCMRLSQVPEPDIMH